LPQHFAAFQMFKKGIALGDVLCMVNIAKMYDTGVYDGDTKVLGQDYRCTLNTIVILIIFH
jgi:hypothetical protein